MEILGEREISRAKRFLKEIMNQNWNFQGDVAIGEVERVGGWVVQTKNPSMGGVRIIFQNNKVN